MYYHLVVKEINKDQEYSYDYLIEANSMAEAKEIAEDKVKTFYNYGDVRKNEEGWYELFYENILVGVTSLKKTTKKAFIAEYLNAVTLGPLNKK